MNKWIARVHEKRVAPVHKMWIASMEAYKSRHLKSMQSKFFDREWLYYGDISIKEQLLASRKRFWRTAAILACATILVMAVWAVSSRLSPNLEKQLSRSAYGGPAKHVLVNAEAEYRGAKTEKQMDLYVLSEELSSMEEKQRLDLCAALLESEMLQENESLAQVSGNLNLITYHERSGVTLSWFSTDPTRVDLDGQVNLIDIEKAEKITLQATLSIGESEKKCVYSVQLISSDSTDYISGIQQSLLKLQEDLNKDTKGGELHLPSETLEGIKVKWSLPEKGVPLFFVPLGLLLLAIAYFSRYDRLIRASKRKKEVIEEEIPNLALQLILLLNAGLVANTAFDEILRQNEESNHPLYVILGTLSRQSAQSNISFITAFYTFSQMTGNRNLLRFATMVADHETRGSELVNKLERERDQLWETRLQRAKAKAREADTKLCLPLMLLLLVLVVISVSPALMDM